MNRDLYAVLVTSANGITPRATQNDTHSPVADVLRLLILANNNPVTPEDIAAGAEAIAEDVSLYEVVSWDGQRIPLDARAGQIPKPGVFFILHCPPSTSSSRRPTPTTPWRAGSWPVLLPAGCLPSAQPVDQRRISGTCHCGEDSSSARSWSR